MGKASKILVVSPSLEAVLSDLAFLPLFGNIWLLGCFDQPNKKTGQCIQFLKDCICIFFFWLAQM